MIGFKIIGTLLFKELIFISTMTETLSINDRKYNLKGISPVAVLVCLLFDEMRQGCVERLYLDV